VSNFVNNISREYTFCAVAKCLPAHEESFLHLFFYCSITDGWLVQFERLYYPEIVFNSVDERKRFWFLHIPPPQGGGGWNFFVSATIWFFKFTIWEAKLKKTVPSMRTLKIEFEILVKNWLLVSNQARDEFKKINYAICRTVGHGRGP